MPLAETDLSAGLIAAVAAALGALAYVVRTLVSRRPAPEEQVRIAILEVVRIIDRRIREMASEVHGLPKTSTACPWDQGRIPEHYERFARGLITEIQLSLARSNPGGHPKA